MKTIAIIPIFILLFCLFVGRTAAQNTSTNSLPFVQGFRLISENDVFFPVANKDKNYTGQFRADLYLHRILDKGWGFPFPRNKKNESYTEQSIFINGQGYTPARRFFGESDLVREDRPFASYIGFGYQRTACWELGETEKFSAIGGKLLLSTELSMGKIGSTLAGKAQNFLHEYISIKSDPVLGWDNQIGAPGRFAYYLKVNSVYYFKKQKKYKTGVVYEGITGYFMKYNKFGFLLTNAEAGSFPNSNISSIISREANPIMVPISIKNILQTILHPTFEFVPSIKIVKWNSMLSGHPIEDRSPYTIPADRVRKAVPEACLRLTWNFINTRDSRLFTFYYAMNWRGKEFDGGDPFHFYGSLGVRTMKK